MKKFLCIRVSLCCFHNHSNFSNKTSAARTRCLRHSFQHKGSNCVHTVYGDITNFQNTTNDIRLEKHQILLQILPATCSSSTITPVAAVLGLAIEERPFVDSTPSVFRRPVHPLTTHG